MKFYDMVKIAVGGSIPGMDMGEEDFFNCIDQDTDKPFPMDSSVPFNDHCYHVVNEMYDAFCTVYNPEAFLRDEVHGAGQYLFSCLELVREHLGRQLEVRKTMIENIKKYTENWINGEVQPDLSIVKRNEPTAIVVPPPRFD